MDRESGMYFKIFWKNTQVNEHPVFYSKQLQRRIQSWRQLQWSGQVNIWQTIATVSGTKTNCNVKDYAGDPNFVKQDNLNTLPVRMR